MPNSAGGATPQRHIIGGYIAEPLPNRGDRLPVNDMATRTSTTSMPHWLACALDVLARAAAEPHVPLERLLPQVVRPAGLGARERRQVGDVVFAIQRRGEGLRDAVFGAAKACRAPKLKPRETHLLLALYAAQNLDLAPDDVGWLPAELLRVWGELDGVAPAPAALPIWLRERLTHLDPSDLVALSQRAPLALAVDLNSTTVSAVLDALRALDVQAQPSALVPTAILVDGRVRLQRLAMHDSVWPMDIGSQIVALAMPMTGDQPVVDLCAGGGGKSRLMASRGAQVISADIASTRLRELADRGGACVQADALAPPFAPRSLRAVLVDAPCSGTGTLRRHPDLAARLTAADVDQYAARQTALLTSAASLLAPGGVLVYATCSLLQQENDAVVDAVLATDAELRPTALAPLWGERVVGLDPLACRQLLHPARHGTDGFFIAALTR